MAILVSVIIPVYNAEKYFKRCMDSVLGQTYYNLEVILIDDGSTDKSGEMCDVYARKDDRVIVHHQKNFGVSAARNWALEHMRGEYVIFVDSDDFIAPDLVDICLQVATENHADIVVFNLQRVFRNTKDIHLQLQEAKINVFENTESIRKKILINRISNYLMVSFYKSSLWGDVRLPDYSSHEDMYILPRIFVKSENIIYIDNVLYYYNRMNNNSLSAENSDFDVQKRYYKYKAYEEHKTWSYILKDKECYDWAVFHMMWEAIKIFYVNFCSSKKLTISEVDEVMNFIENEWTPDVKRKMRKKMVILRWATMHFPYLCKIYGFIRYKQEYLKRWIKN